MARVEEVDPCICGQQKYISKYLLIVFPLEQIVYIYKLSTLQLYPIVKMNCHELNLLKTLISCLFMCSADLLTPEFYEIIKNITMFES